MNPREMFEAMREKTIMQQKAKMATYVALRNAKLPIPKDLDRECKPFYKDHKDDPI